MIEKSQRWIAKYVGKNWAYYIVFTTYTILTTIPTIILGYLFDCMAFMIISNLIVNIMRSLTYGYHNKSNIKCTILTYTLLIIVGYISKTTSMEWSFFIALISARYIYIKAPLRLTKKGKDKRWHRSRIQFSIWICLFASIVFLYLQMYIIASAILWSLIMVALTLFENIDI